MLRTVARPRNVSVAPALRRAMNTRTIAPMRVASIYRNYATAPQGTAKQYSFLQELGIEDVNPGVYFNGKWGGKGPLVTSINPATGKPIASVRGPTMEEYEEAMKCITEAQKAWQATPAPKRGEVIRELGDAFRAKKKALGQLVSLEMGKIAVEGQGEVQEIIDICDYAVGLSRYFDGKIFPSERPDHFIHEYWHPLGTVGIITAFNFPMAVFGWNTSISLVCGNAQVWKGATTTALCTLAASKIVANVFEKNNLPPVCASFCSGREIGERMSLDPRISLISFTGSTEVGRMVSKNVHSRFGKTILELGGNNALVVMDDANLDVTLPAIVFGAVGTAGQRCTSTRRVLIHEKVYDEVVARLKRAYSQIRIGDPLDEKSLMGPLHTKGAVKEYEDGLKEILKQGGRIIYGGRVLSDRPGNFVEPTIVEINHDAPIVKTELFVPILYVMKIKSIEEAIQYNNEVPQGLSSALFTQNVINYFKWVGPGGSDCGMANLNCGTSGAEIGGAFGGEKETGGGRESGSDAWKQYCRRLTSTINASNKVALAQGIKFD